MDGPRCYACTAPATTKCVKCEALSCALHLRSLRGRHGYYLLCHDCFAWAKRSQLLTLVVGVPLVLVAPYLLCSFLVR